MCSSPLHTVRDPHDFINLCALVGQITNLIRESLFGTVLMGYDFREYFGPKTLKINKEFIYIFYETFLTAVTNQSVFGDVKSDYRIRIVAGRGGSSLPHAAPGAVLT